MSKDRLQIKMVLVLHYVGLTIWSWLQLTFLRHELTLGMFLTNTDVAFNTLVTLENKPARMTALLSSKRNKANINTPLQTEDKQL